MDSIKLMLQNWEFWLSLSLLAGVAVNLFGAWRFFRKPEKSANDIGLVLGDEASPQTRAILTLMRLVGVCLVALAIFYFITALGPTQQAWSVVSAILARATGVIFYAWTLSKFGGPPAFKSYLVVNLALALFHTLFLVMSTNGLAELKNSWDSFYWIKFL